jgi:hypothetical protein
MISPSGTFSTRTQRLMSTVRTPASRLRLSGRPRAAHGVHPAVDKLVPNQSFDEREHLHIVARVDGDGDPGDDI